MDTSLHICCYTVHLITYFQFYLLKYNTLLHIFNSICLNGSVTTNCCLHSLATTTTTTTKDFFFLFFFQTFKKFLTEVVNMNMKLWKFSNSLPAKLLGFGKHGKILFKTIVELVIAYHKKRKFSSHLFGKLHFFPDLTMKHPFILLRMWLAVNFSMTRRQICYIWGIIPWVFNYFANFFLYIQYLFAYHIFFMLLLLFFITHKHTITRQLQNC